MSDDMVRYRALVAEAAGGFDPQKILSHITLENNEEIKLEIILDLDIDDIELNDVFMYVDTEDEDGESLGAHVTVYTEYRDEEDGEDDYYVDRRVDDIDQDEFKEHVKKALINAGFSNAASDGIEFMDSDRYAVWYDAQGVLAEIKKAIEMKGGIGLIIAVKHGFDRNDPDNEPNKTALMKWMLTLIKERGKIPFIAKAMAEDLKRIGISWAELDPILRSSSD